MWKQHATWTKKTCLILTAARKLFCLRAYAWQPGAGRETAWSQCREHVALMLRLCWRYLRPSRIEGPPLGPCWARLGPSSWAYLGPMLGLCWPMFGSMLALGWPMLALSWPSEFPCKFCQMLPNVFFWNQAVCKRLQTCSIKTRQTRNTYRCWNFSLATCD